MNTVDILKAARAKIDTPEKWTTQTFGRDKHHVPAHSDRELRDCVCFCALGALAAATPIGSRRSLRRLLQGVVVDAEAMRALTNTLETPAYDMSSSSISVFNDTHDHEEVLKLYDDTIESLS